MLNHWLPWIHKFISNAKSWIVGTHNGVESQYLAQYLSEYAYRFKTEATILIISSLEL